MKRVTFTIAAVLLAVPAVSLGKTGVEFDNAIEQQRAGTKQSFSVIVMREPRDPMGGEPKAIAGVGPVVRFRNTSSGEVVTARVGATGSDGVARGSVTFPASGMWSVEMRTPGVNVGIHPQEFATGTPAHVVETVAPARPGSPPDSGTGWWPLVLSLPAAGLAAIGLRMLRRRPRPA